MPSKAIRLNGDSMGAGQPKDGSIEPSKLKLTHTTSIYKNLQIGKPIGVPSVSKAEITAAVRSVMKEDGII